MSQMYVMRDAYGKPVLCHLCGRPADAVVNVTANCASSVPSVMRPVCVQHNPYRIELPIGIRIKVRQ